MADTIIVRVSELRARIQDARRDGADYVQLTISDPDEFDGDIIPTSLSIRSCRVNNLAVWNEYDDIDAVIEENQLPQESNAVIHLA
jgi:hypothetical protein